MKTSQFCLTALAGVGLLLSVPTRAQGALSTILDNGPTSNRINIVVLSEGYTSAQLSQFLVDATNAVNNFLAVSPYAEYRDSFNAFAISVASAESGSDHYFPDRWLVDTYFNSSFDSYHIPQLLTIPPNDRNRKYRDGMGKVDALLQALMPEYDLVMMLVNDSRYGGSGGNVLISSLHYSSAETIRHESGHTLANLADEYNTPYTGYIPLEKPNATTETNRTLVKWAHLIAPSTPVPTPGTWEYYHAVGLFEGAQYQPTGWYRPKYDCKMNHLGVQFCEVCSEHISRVLTALTAGATPPMPAALTLVYPQFQQRSGFSFLVTGGPGMDFVVEASTNLTDWFPISTNTLSPVGQFNYTDPTSVPIPLRFFRATLFR